MLKIKIIFSLILSFIITTLLSNIFLYGTPRINKLFLSKIISPKPSPSPIPSTPVLLFPTAAISLQPSPSPTKKFSLPTTYQVSKTPTPIPKPTTKPTATLKPTQPPFASCLKNSNQSYSSIQADHNASNGLFGNPATSPEINLRLRGWLEVNEGTNLISREGDTGGLDPLMPPQISSLYGGPFPQIIKTYRIYEWDFENNKSAAPQTATPNFKVHMIGLKASPGQKLFGLQAGREIGGGNVFMVLYATEKDIVFTHSNSDTLLGGYLFYFLDICVDPNLLAKYQQDNASGREKLPVVATGQVFGYAGNTDVKVVVRDTMSFMDTRYKEDWWEWKPWQ